MKGVSLLIYLDYAATTPVYSEIYDNIPKWLDIFGNPSSIHTLGRTAHAYLREAREVLAQTLHVPAETIYLTSGATEANNLIIQGVIRYLKDVKQQAKPKVVTSEIEHPSVLTPLTYLEEQGIIELRLFPVTDSGKCDLTQLDRIITPDIDFVSIMMVNNETGVIQPIQEITDYTKAHTQALIHTDAVQALTHINIDLTQLKVDFLTISAHKVNALKGVGAAYIKNKHQLVPLIFGGKQEQGIRPGTENLLGALAFSKALCIHNHHQEQEQMNNEHCWNVFFDTLRQFHVTYHIHGEHVLKTDHIRNIYFPDITDHQQLLIYLDQHHIYLSTGSACSAGVVTASHVLKAMYGEHHPSLHTSLRISIGSQTTPEQMKEAAQQIAFFIQNRTKDARMIL